MNKTISNNKDNVNKIKKISSRIFIIILLLIVLISGTFAWFTYSSRKSALVLTIGNIDSTRMVLTPYQIRETMAPVSTYTDGVSSKVEVINNNSTKKQILLYYKINNLSEELINNGLKYTIAQSNTKNGTYTEVVTDDFSDAYNGEIIVLSTDINANTTIYYKVYVWLSNEVDQSALQNLSLDIELNGIIPMQPETPQLDDGMIPVTIANDGTVTTIAEDDTSWYDYSNKKWANVVLVSDTNRQEYLDNLSTNMEVAEEDILAYYVWIPRYKYLISEPTTCGDIENPTVEEYTECYAPYTVPEETRQELINHYLVTSGTGCNGLPDDTAFNDLTEEEIVAMYYDADLWVDDCLNDGLCENWYGENSFPKYVAEINNEIDDGYTFLEDCGYRATTKLSYTASEFNSTKVLNKTTDILFEDKDETLSKGNAVNTYYTNPAFWWDNDNDGIVDTGETLGGIWVGKFEVSTDTSSDCYTYSKTSGITDEVRKTYCNNSDESVRILPNVYSLRFQNISTQFQTAQKMGVSGNIYGISDTYTESHMMKNSEWGAVAYLSRSKYGKDSEVYLNSNSKNITGCGAEYVYSPATTTCVNEYGRGVSWYLQSTTGNITGIFDMSGGSREYVMGNYRGRVGLSEFTEMPEQKYYDLYPSSISSIDTCTLDSCGGHALYETTGWYGDANAFYDTGGPWLRRGGRFDEGSAAGIFSYYRSDGSEYRYTWRSVLINLD